MTRRDLIQKVLIGGTTVLVVPSVISSCSKEEDGDNGGNGNTGTNKFTINLTDQNYASLNTAGGFVVIATKKIIVANTGNNAFVALASECTHEGCTVTYNATSNNFPCPCHQSLFSSTGAVVNGPATVALKSYPVAKEGNVLTITL
ncbi:MAG: Rieske (2Fe-2S) protein [Bacteroidales bacterium]|nr:Rieske (2Fe-2S) protein [Bacteroidales bacterium]